ncbi:MAG TPA: hypothetical protein VK662_00070, partial [Acidothermaceae bacterium]|nr:hypothetical protein [Acidothermaceae bacterium]
MTATVLVAFGTGACTPRQHYAENTTYSALSGDKGEIKGVLAAVGGPAGSSSEPVQGEVDVYTLGGHQVAYISGASAWNFELEPGTYTLQATVLGLVCPPIQARVDKGT